MAAAIGFRVKTGWAAAVLLSGPGPTPTLLDSRRLELSDPEHPESRQPYHAGFGTERTDRDAVAHLVGLVEAHAGRNLADLLETYRRAPGSIQAAGLVVGSDIDPLSIANPHIRAHAAEGRLYRRVVEGSLRRAGLIPEVFLEKGLRASAAQRLGMSEAELRSWLAIIGRKASGPWRSEEKEAATAAWLVLGGAPERAGHS